MERALPAPDCGTAQAAEVAAAALACRALAALPRQPGERVVAGDCRPVIGHLTGTSSLWPLWRHL
eukprot:8875941-Alexandrium_andersonii.AAC.1